MARGLAVAIRMAVGAAVAAVAVGAAVAISVPVAVVRAVRVAVMACRARNGGSVRARKLADAITDAVLAAVGDVVLARLHALRHRRTPVDRVEAAGGYRPSNGHRCCSRGNAGEELHRQCGPSPTRDGLESAPAVHGATRRDRAGRHRVPDPAERLLQLALDVTHGWKAITHTGSRPTTFDTRA